MKRGTYIYGSTSNAGIGADKTKKNLGENDFWFIEAKDTALTNAPLITNKMAAPVLQKQALFNVYPNPVKDKLQVQVDGKATVSLMMQTARPFSGKLFKTAVLLMWRNYRQECIT